jgi:non-specific serine/threonine protein kinase
LIELASISDPALVPQTVTATLGVPEVRDAQPTLALTKYLRTKQTLLILDNCEQIVAPTAQLAEELLRACPEVQILVTSREILSLTGEIQFRVPPLSLSKENSSNNDPFFHSEAVQLFLDRAQAVLPSFVLTGEVIPIVTQICQLVDGLPLGIELAAAKMSLLSVEQIANRLHDSLQLLHGGRISLPHHKTLEATLQWSYDLLSEVERTLIQRLSVFLGGWTLEAAESVVSDPGIINPEKVLDLISQLVNKSLIVVDWQPRAEVRYTMLQTIREFASEKLHATGGTEHIRSRHFDYFLALAQKAQLFGEEKGIWLDRLEAEHDNIQAALKWSLELGEIEKGAELILPILDFYWFRGYSTEAREWMEKFLEIELPASRQRALLLQKAGWLTRAAGNFEKANLLLQHALEMALEIGDKNRAAWALMDMGRAARDQGNNRQAVSFFSQSLTFAQESAEPRAIGRCLYNLAESYDLTGELDKSRKFWEAGLNIFRMEGDQTSIAGGLEGLAGIAYLTKDFASAFKFHLESLRLKVDVMDKLGLAFSLEGLAQMCAAQREAKRAAVLWGAADRLRKALNVPLESSREHLYTSLIPSTRDQIGAEAFEQAWKKGREMKLNEAIEFALTLPDH